MEHRESRHLTIANRHCDLGPQFDELDWKTCCTSDDFRKEHFHSLADTCPDIRWILQKHDCGLSHDNLLLI